MPKIVTLTHAFDNAKFTVDLNDYGSASDRPEPQDMYFSRLAPEVAEKVGTVIYPREDDLDTHTFYVKETPSDICFKLDGCRVPCRQIAFDDRPFKLDPARFTGEAAKKRIKSHGPT